MKIKILSYPDCNEEYRRFNLYQYRSLAQHSLGWQKMLAEWEGIQWSAIGLYDNLNNLIGCIPFCISEHQIGKVAMSSPLPASYGGVLHIETNEREEIYKILLDELVRYLRTKGVDVLTILTSPFRNDVDLYMKYMVPDYCLPKFYQYIPRTSNIMSNINRNIKRNLRKAREYELDVCHSSIFDEGLIHKWYVNVLINRFKDIGAEPAPEKFYKSLLNILTKDKIAEFLYISYQNEVVAGGIFLFGWCQDIFLRASSTDALSLGASILLDYEGICRGISKGVNAHNFQSSPSRESSAYFYKRQWGCVEENTYYLVKVLTDTGKFTSLGKDEVSKAFPYFFVLPYYVYEVKK